MHREVLCPRPYSLLQTRVPTCSLCSTTLAQPRPPSPTLAFHRCPPLQVKICKIVYARIQGLIPLTDHFKNSQVMKGGKTSRPLVLGGGGPQGQDGGQQGQGQGQGQGHQAGGGGPAGGGQGGARNGARGVPTMGGGRGQPGGGRGGRRRNQMPPQRLEEWNNAPVVCSVTEGKRVWEHVSLSVPWRREMW